MFLVARGALVLRKTGAAGPHGRGDAGENASGHGVGDSTPTANPRCSCCWSRYTRPPEDAWKTSLPYTERRKTPINSETTNATRKMKNRILAMPAAPAA